MSRYEVDFGNEFENECLKRGIEFEYYYSEHIDGDVLHFEKDGNEATYIIAPFKHSAMIALRDFIFKISRG